MAIVLSDFLIGLLCSMRKYIVLLKILFDQVFHPLQYIQSAILYTNQYYHLINETKHMFEPRIRYCHIYLVCKSMRYERKMHVLIIGK